jgi:glycosyltransferase involved in cell wall biosynthesis
MEPAPRVRAAVVIPTFDNAAEIGRAVASVLAAARTARPDFDLALDMVLADDASRDASAAIAQDIARAPDLPEGVSILTVRNAVNRGAGPTRNAGAAATDADFLFFLDADDEFLPPHIGLCLSALLADPSIGYVWGRRDWDLPVHDSWRDRLDQSSVMNLCVRRPWHDLIGGFPEHPDFRDRGYEDCVYRVLLRRLTRGRAIPETTTRVHLRGDNALERQRDKFATRFENWRAEDDDRQPSAAMIAELEARLETVRRVRESFLSPG